MPWQVGRAKSSNAMMSRAQYFPPLHVFLHQRKFSLPNLRQSVVRAFTSGSKASRTVTPKHSQKTRRNILSVDLVQSPKVKAVLPLIGHISYMTLASGFLMTDMLVLRVALVGGYSGLVAFHLLHRKPLRIPLRWSALFVVVNAGAACFLAADRWAGQLTSEDEVLYKEHFQMLSRGQFHQLLSLAHREDLPDGTALTAEGVPCDKVYFISKGTAKLYLRDFFAAVVGEGSFVNDVAFQQGAGVGAYGTVVTSRKCSVLIWDQSTLRNHLENRPDMDRNMKYCFTTHLVKGLMQQREAAHLTKGQWNKDTKQWQPNTGPIVRSASQYRIVRDVSEPVASAASESTSNPVSRLATKARSD